MHPLIVIGAGLAGWTTIRELRKLDPESPVLLVCADDGDFYAKPTLSNAFGQQRSPAQLVTTPAASMAQTQKVSLLARTRVLRIDPQAHRIAVQGPDGVQALHYRQLVLATGAQAIRVALAGDATDAVLSVNSLQDFAVLHAALQGAPAPAAPKSVLIMGAGLIGCEFANDLAQAGFAVQVTDPAPHPLATLLPAPAGLQVQQALQDLGVRWHFGTSLQTLDHAGPALRATLGNGVQLAVDVVLSAIGLRAETALAQAAGIACARGILVDALLQTSASDVYALGDCAQYASAGQRTLPYVMPIMNAARALVATLAGTPTPLVFPLMPVSIKTPAWPVVVASAHPNTAGQWQAEALASDAGPGGAWRFLDTAGVQRGFVLSAKQTARRMEFAKGTLTD